MMANQLARKSIRFLVWLLVSLFGIVSQVTGDARAAEPTAAASDAGAKGTIVLSVSHDKGIPRVFGSTGKHIALTFKVRAVGGGTIEFEFSTSTVLMAGLTGAKDIGDDLGRVQIMELPVGRYAIYDWRILEPTGLSEPAAIRVLKSTSELLPLFFEISAGEAIYLGNLHATLTHKKQGIFGGEFLVGAVPEVRDRSDRDLPLALEKHPELRDTLKIHLLPVGMWSPE